MINKQILSTINVGGQGGAEKKILPALPGYSRINEELYDFINESKTSRVELKKQANTQWFDVGKYHDLSDHDRTVTMLFLLHKDGIPTSVHTISLGEMLDTLTNDKEFQKDGWDWDLIKVESALKEAFPKRQSKVPLKVRDFIDKYHYKFQRHY